MRPVPDRVFPRLTRAMRLARRAVPEALRGRGRRWMFEWLDLTWPTTHGIRLRVGDYAQWILYNEVWVNGDYDRALGLMLDTPRQAGAPLHVVDMGANVGYFTLRALDRALARGVPLESVTVTAFEANDAFVRQYRSRVLEENALGARIRIVAGAVGARGGRAVMEGIRIVGAGDHGVPYVDVSAQLADVPSIDLLKCDIEGSEQGLLENYPDVLAKTRVAVFELHRDFCDTERCRALLRRYGFVDVEARREGHHVSVLTVRR